MSRGFGRACIPLGLAVGLMAGARCTPTDPNGNDNHDPGEITFELSPSGRAVQIIDRTGFADLLAKSATEPTPVLQPIVEGYIRLFAAAFPNEADFAIFTIDEHRERLRFGAVGGFNITLRVPEAGLGPFVSVPDFADLPHLRSYIYLARKDSLVLGPALHELAHGWGVRFINPPELGAQVSESDNHWGFSSVGGQMGGWLPGTLVDLGDGQFRLSSGQIEAGGRSFNTVPYAPIELYLMGLAEPDEVQPLEVAINPVFQSLFEFAADRIDVLDIEDIIAANGERVPASADSQKDFKIALVVLSDHEFIEGEWTFYEDSMDYFSFPGPAQIADAFPEERYAGQPIRDLIAQPDPEDASRRFLNFYDAALGRATVEFIPLQPQ